MLMIETYQQIIQSIPPQVRLIAVSKTHTPNSILELYQAGQRMFGENKVQELLQKYPVLPADIEWHMIGHLQTNKVKSIVPFVSCIQSVDSVKLLEVINKEAAKANRLIDCLLEVHIATESTKFGYSADEVHNLFSSGSLHSMSHIRVTGLMGMATFTDDLQVVRAEFRMLKSLFDTIKANFPEQADKLKDLSMGMSDDYMIAIEEGSTMVRLGSILFGARQYPIS
jgi:PLP dependent protein